METPNTRARKRMLETSQDSSVTWGQDDAMLRELVSDSTGKPLPLPSPTQKPRRLGASASLTSTSLSSNKRPRRLRGSASLSAATTGSTPAPTGTERNRLDELLDRFLDPNRPSSSAPSLERSSSLSSRTPLSDRSKNGTPVGPAGSDRVGETKGGKNPSSWRETHTNPRHAAQRVRSSPRRTVAANTSKPAPSPLRTTPMPRAEMSASRRTAQHGSWPNVHQTPHTRPAPPEPRTHPSSDGDTSVDSLDMMFQGGGEEIEMLLAAVDGRG